MQVLKAKAQEINIKVLYFLLIKAICVGSEGMQIMYPAIFDQLLAFVEFSCKPPQYGQLETKHIANAKYNQVIS